jgi:hypothetical protein
MTQRFGTICAMFVIAMGLAAPTIAAAQGAAPAQTAPARGARGGGAPTPPCGPVVSGIKNVAKDSRCFELRTYTVRPDGAGNIDLLHSRFRDVTARLFIKHGMTIVGFWQPLAKPDTLVYLMAYKDGAARDAEWAAFNTDPEWVKARTEINVAVNVDAVFMNATDYSPMK